MFRIRIRFIWIRIQVFFSIRILIQVKNPKFFKDVTQFSTNVLLSCSGRYWFKLNNFYLTLQYLRIFDFAEVVGFCGCYIKVLLHFGWLRPFLYLNLTCWIRIRISNPDPDSGDALNPDPIRIRNTEFSTIQSSVKSSYPFSYYPLISVIYTSLMLYTYQCCGSGYISIRIQVIFPIWIRIQVKMQKCSKGLHKFFIFF